jgi:hypothetical protein
MLHTALRKKKNRLEIQYCNNERCYSLYYVCHYPWTFPSISFLSLLSFIHCYALLFLPEVAQSAQYKATRQNMLQHYIYAYYMNEAQLHHKRL